jgi:molybdopterin/thiamine biosynthesis adenylyltransferase/rhodanese-related sulfurtransferase
MASFLRSMADLTPAELTRYSRHLLLPELGLAGQARLKAARVLVLGAGGLGSPAALYLAAAGVGTLGIADFDRVEAHNLQRQLLHDDTTVGQSKTASAAARLRATNPHITVVPHEGRVTAVNILALFAGYDIIVDGTDNFPTRYLAGDAAVLARRPLVHGSIHQFEGQVAVFAPHLGGPCHRCLFPAPPAAGTVPNCAEAGVLGALCGVIGSLQALEALKLAAGFGTPLLGRLLLVDALGANFRTLTLAPDPGCPACGPGATLRELRAENYDFSCAVPTSENGHPTGDAATGGADAEVPLEISVEETKRLLDTRPDGVLLIDVREPHELAICRIAGAKAIPMREIPAHVGDLPRDKHLLIHCHSGMRSMRVTEYLRAQGFPAVSNVGGGIAAWAARIDPGMARY